jgi:hypothetical protein
MLYDLVSAQGHSRIDISMMDEANWICRKEEIVPLLFAHFLRIRSQGAIRDLQSSTISGFTQGHSVIKNPLTIFQ